MSFSLGYSGKPPTISVTGIWCCARGCEGRVSAQRCTLRHQTSNKNKYITLKDSVVLGQQLRELIIHGEGGGELLASYLSPVTSRVPGGWWSCWGTWTWCSIHLLTVASVVTSNILILEYSLVFRSGRKIDRRSFRLHRRNTNESLNRWINRWSSICTLLSNHCRSRTNPIPHQSQGLPWKEPDSLQQA